MKIIGIDPGTATTGYGVIEIVEEKLIPVKFDLIETSKNGTPEQRLASIHRQLLDIFDIYQPEEMAIEKVFFATNRKTAIRVGQAQGVMLLAAATYNLPVFEYAPGTIKKVVSGNGRADKKMVEQSVRDHLGSGVHSRPNEKTHFDNAADALAVALCHIYTSQKRGEKLWQQLIK